MTEAHDAPTDDELVVLAQDVSYEYEMALAAAGRLVRLRDLDDERGLTGDEGVEQNAWLEVFVLHARNMHDFFANKPFRDDVTAGHYVSSWTPEGDHDFDVLSSVQKQTNKHLAHITAQRRRTPVEQRGWPWFDVAESLLHVWERFSGQLNATQREWFSLDPDQW